MMAMGVSPVGGICGVIVSIGVMEVGVTIKKGRLHASPMNSTSPIREIKPPQEGLFFGNIGTPI
jgi:hypothetical protein